MLHDMACLLSASSAACDISTRNGSLTKKTYSTFARAAARSSARALSRSFKAHSRCRSVLRRGLFAPQTRLCFLPGMEGVNLNFFRIVGSRHYVESDLHIRVGKHPEDFGNTSRS